MWVFNSDTKADKILRKTAGCTSGRVDGSVSVTYGGQLTALLKLQRRTADVRHHTGHADQAVYAAKANANTPQPCPTDDFLAQLLVACLETKHRAVSVGDAVVDIAARMGSKPRVVHLEPEQIEVVRDHLRCGLLPIHAQRERLDTAKQEERIDRRQGIPDGVDDESRRS